MEQAGSLAMDAWRATTDFDGLMAEGWIALNNNDRKLAHDLWREAALLDPYDERVWLALLEVLKRPEDRHVCLQNIVEINPMNAQARRMLRAYEARVERRDQVQRQRNRKTIRRISGRWSLVRRALFLGLVLGLAGVVIAIALSILIYAL